MLPATVRKRSANSPAIRRTPGDADIAGHAGRRREEELIDDLAQIRDRFTAVDPHAEVRAAFESLRVPAAERANLVDDPTFAAARRRRRIRFGRPAFGARRDVPESAGFIHPVTEEKADVFEEKLTARRQRDRLWTSPRGEVG